METTNEIYELYDAYIRKVKELEANRKITAGLFGITKGPKDDPCHDQFAEDLTAKINEFAASDPASEEIRSLLEYMYRIPLNYKDDSMIYYMFAAVHTLKYSRNYPRWERLPAQKKVLKALNRPNWLPLTPKKG